MRSDERLPLRIVVDTNILVRGTLSASGASALVIEALKRGRCTLITSRAHLSELYRVLSRPRLMRRYGVTSKRRKQLVSRLYAGSIFVTPTGKLALCRDPEDDFLLEMALLGRATHLVTEDADLYDAPDILELLRQHGARVMRLAEFLVDLAQSSTPSNH
ncbi:MAG: putative toxin-antitoxin system toxin component, PIN family [Chloroflexi bacterium]|nr:putative toxin-antitoxin system toxin component, PIN family [Chloroflexota bacterium]